MARLTKHEWGGLWAVFWRVLLLAPILWMLGFALLVFVFSLLFAPLTYAVVAFLTGDWLLGIGLLVAWILILRFIRRLLAWMFQGIEYISI